MRAPRPEQCSSIEVYRALITPLVLKGVGPQAIHDRIRQEHPKFNESVSEVKRLCRSIRRARGVRPEDIAIPLETEPGQEAQVDFGYVGQLYDPTEGRLRKAFVIRDGAEPFRAISSARISFDQKVEAWLLLHMEAFEHLGGVPAVIVADNLKSAVIRAAFSPSEPTMLNRSPLRHDEPTDLYELIRVRYEVGPIVITSNRDIEEWPPLFGGNQRTSLTEVGLTSCGGPSRL